MYIYIIANEQTNANEAIVQVVTEATRAAIQAMAVGRAERIQNNKFVPQSHDTIKSLQYPKL